MMDYDGTIVPIRSNPGAARPCASLLKRLQAVARKPHIVTAVVTGRDLEDLRRMLPIDGLYMVGCHGAEYLHPDGGRYNAVNTAALAPVITKISDLGLRCIGNHSGFLIESKKTSCALHYRRARPSAVREVLARFITDVRQLVGEHNLKLLAGKKVLEICPQSVSKAQAVRYLMRRHPGYYPVYFGDDITDEDAFESLRGTGAGVLVAAVDRPTAAVFRVRGPEEVSDILQFLSMGCEH